MKFKVGDIVVLKKDIKGIDTVGIFEQTIEKISGVNQKVTDAHTESSEKRRNIINLQGSPFHWNSEMFNLVAKNQTIVIHTKGRDTIATLENGNTVIKTAKATCNPFDTFDFKVGAKLAFERLVGSETKEIKRRAEVGEWIKIIDAYAACGNYKNGDIFQVAKSNLKKDCFVENIEIMTSKVNFPAILTTEYVVLENYIPTNQPAIDYSTIDYTKLDGAKLFEEIQRRVKING